MLISQEQMVHFLPNFGKTWLKVCQNDNRQVFQTNTYGFCSRRQFATLLWCQVFTEVVHFVKCHACAATWHKKKAVNKNNLKTKSFPLSYNFTPALVNNETSLASIIIWQKRKVLMKHRLHGKKTVSVLLKLFIYDNERCLTTDVPYLIDVNSWYWSTDSIWKSES